MTEALVPYKTQAQGSIIRTMDDAERAARAMVASGFFQDAKQQAQAVVKILAGQELGIGPFASMTGVNIIQNRVALAANLLAAAVKRTGKYNYRIIKATDNECEIAFFEGGQEVGRTHFTMDDAAKAGLVGKDNWKRYPSDMLFARAISRGQRRYAPDIFGGTTVYTPDELGAVVDEEGNAVQDEWDGKVAAQNDNPDPISDALWDHWQQLCVRAEKVDVPYAIIDRAKTTAPELTAAGKELRKFVEDAEDQAKAA